MLLSYYMITVFIIKMPFSTFIFCFLSNSCILTASTWTEKCAMIWMIILNCISTNCLKKQMVAVYDDPPFLHNYDIDDDCKHWTMVEWSLIFIRYKKLFRCFLRFDSSLANLMFYFVFYSSKYYLSNNIQVEVLMTNDTNNLYHPVRRQYFYIHTVFFVFVFFCTILL